MSDTPVKHLLDEAGDGAEGASLMRAALRGARADVPDAARVEALSRSIAGAIGAGGGDGGGGGSEGGGGGGGGGSGGGAGTGAGAGMTGATKLAIGGVALAAAIGAAAIATRTPAVSTEPTTTTTATAASTPTPIPTPIPTSSAEPGVDVHNLPSAATTVADAARATTSATTRTGSPEAEMSLLRTAQDALGRSPAEALARCEEHAKTYPDGALAEEREVLAVDALLRLGRRPEAESRAARFRTSHPGSAYVRRLDTLLGKTP